jgi:putative transposase
MSYTCLLYHIVIRTKRSEPTICEDHERELYAYIYEFLKNHDCKLYRLNGMPDHLHILVSIHPSIALSDLLRDLKTATSKMMKADRQKFPMFDGWGSEYFACTVSLSKKEKVREYIINQKEHHKHIKTRDEIIQLCEKNGIPYNEKYI